MEKGMEFLRQAKTALDEFVTFIKENRFYAYMCAALIFLCWGDAALREDVGIDTEIMIASPEEILDSWYGIGRFALVWTKRLLRTDRFSQTTCIVAMMAAIWLCCAAVGFSVWIFCGKDRRYRYFYPAFSAVFVTAPVLTEQVYFSFQAFEVMLGVFLILLSLHMAERWLFLGESFFWLVPAFLCGVWAIGIYQSIAVAFLAFAAFSFLVFYQSDLYSERQGRFPCFFLLFRLAVFFVLMVVAYFAISFTVKSIVGYNTGYLKQMFVWPSESLQEGIRWILVEILRVYWGKQVFYSSLSFLVFALWFVLNTVQGFGARKKEFPLFFLVSVCFAASPLLMTVLLGFPQPTRMQLAYPLSFALAVASLSALISGKGEADKAGPAGKMIMAVRTWGYVPVLILCAVLTWNQLVVTERLLDTIHTIAVQDFSRSREIYREIQQVSADSGRSEKELTAVYIGTLKPEENTTTLRGDVVGHSLFEWDSTSPVGVSTRVRGLMFAHGFPYMPDDPTPEQYEAAREFAADMPCWPLDGSVAVYEDMVVVKLSEPAE